MSIINPTYEKAKEASLALARHYLAEAQKAGLSPQDVLAGFLAVYIKAVDAEDPANLGLMMGAVGLMPATKEQLRAAFEGMMAKRIG